MKKVQTLERGQPLTRTTNRPGAIGGHLRQTVLHVIVLFFAVISVAPFIWMIFGSFKAYKELVSSTALLPHVWTVNNYNEIITRVNFLTAMRNSVISAVSTTVSVMLTSSLCGYVFAKYRFPGKEILFTILLSTLMVPFSVVLVPLYIFISDLGLSDKLAGIIVPGLWSTFGIFLMRQFMEGIPLELLDAARVDGVNEWQRFRYMTIPLLSHTLLLVVVLGVIGSLQVYTSPTVLTQGGPGTSTFVYNMLIVQTGFTNFRFGVAAAAALLQFVVIFVISMIQLKLLRPKWSY